MKAAIQKELKAANLQIIDVTVTKIIQLFETKNSRHSVMIVGLSGSGKSVTWKMLRNTLTRLKKENKGNYQAVKVTKIVHSSSQKNFPIKNLPIQVRNHQVLNNNYSLLF